MVNLSMACSDKLVSPFGGMPLIKCLIDQAGIRELHAIRDMPQSGSNHTRYDGLARRITRYTNAEDVTMHSYYNDEWRPVEERKDNETTAAASYLWGSRHRDDLVRRDRAVGGTTLNETRYILMDYFSPAAITDEEGDVTERYQFSAFGLRTILNPDFTVRSDSECGMELSFQGQFEDVETGWLNYGYRYYLPALGRWICKDPIGERGGENLYAFIFNNPTSSTDFLGLSCDPIEVVAGHGNAEGTPRTGPDYPEDPLNRNLNDYAKEYGNANSIYVGCGANRCNKGGIGKKMTPNKLDKNRGIGKDELGRSESCEKMQEAWDLAIKEANQRCKDNKDCDSINVWVKCLTAARPGDDRVETILKKDGCADWCSKTEEVPCNKCSA